MQESLQELCLKFIVDNFERYHYNFSANNENFKFDFEFLRRKFSFEIVKQLHNKDKIQENYIDFLMNKHLKTFDAYWFNSFSLERPWKDVICRLPNLRILCFRDDCHDEILKNVAEFCPKIREIDVTNSSITDEGIMYLRLKENGTAAGSEIEKLFISSTNVTEEGVKFAIKNLPSLAVIDHPKLPEVLYSMHKYCLPVLQEVEKYNLVRLNLTRCARLPYFSELVKVCLSVCPRLKYLTYLFSNDEQLTLLSSSNLERLYLKNLDKNTKIDTDIFLKSHGLNLTSLMIHNCTVSVFVLAENCPNLKHLYLSEVTFSYDYTNQHTISTFFCLRSCNFVSPRNKSSTAKAINFILSFAPDLEDISFRNCILSPGIKTDILKCCEKCPIQSINFSYAIVEMEYVKNVLQSCSSLIILNVDNCGLLSTEEEELYRFVDSFHKEVLISFGEMVHFYNELSDYYDTEEESDDTDDSEED